jgi:hypothetical protein
MRRLANSSLIAKSTALSHRRLLQNVARYIALLLASMGPGTLTSPRAEQDFDVSQLVGSAIHASITNLQNGIREGRKFSNPFQQNYIIELQEHKALRVTFSATAFTPRGNISQKPETHVRELEIPSADLAAARGGGHGVWFFDSNILTFVRTYEGGAMKATFAVSRTGTELRCSATNHLGKGSRRVEHQIQVVG